MKSFKYIILAFGFISSVLCSCTDDDVINNVKSDKVGLRFLSRNNESVNNKTDIDLSIVNGYRFENGILKEVFNNIKNNDGIYNIQPQENSGSIYFLANATEALKNKELIIGKTRIEDFNNMIATVQEMQSEGILMTGSLEQLNESLPVNSIALRRSLARIDVESLISGVQVHRIIVRSLSDKGYINPQPLSSVSELSSKYDIDIKMESPFESKKMTIAYVCEQLQGSSHQVEMIATINGINHKLSTVLKDIKRNNIYTLKIKGNGASFELIAEAEGWENAPSTDAELVKKGLVDVNASDFSEGVRVSENCDTVFVPYYGSNFNLSIKAESGASVVVNGNLPGSVVSTSTSIGVEESFSVSVASSLRMPGDEEGYIYLDLYKGNVQTDRVVLVFEVNPVLLTGLIKFDTDGVCNFNKYIDGELGRIILPEDNYITMEYDEGESQWIKLEKTTGNNNEFRILGGWKPNDPKADGREQIARMVVRSHSGKHSETYFA